MALWISKILTNKSNHHATDASIVLTSDRSAFDLLGLVVRCWNNRWGCKPLLLFLSLDVQGYTIECRSVGNPLLVDIFYLEGECRSLLCGIQGSTTCFTVLTLDNHP